MKKNKIPARTSPKKMGHPEKVKIRQLPTGVRGLDECEVGEVRDRDQSLGLHLPDVETQHHVRRPCHEPRLGVPGSQELQGMVDVLGHLDLDRHRLGSVV